MQVNNLFRKRFATLLFPTIAPLYATAYLLAWHLTLIGISAVVSVGTFPREIGVIILISYSLGLAGTLLYLVVALRIAGNRILRGVCNTVVLIPLLLLLLMRMVEWGTVFFAGQQVDREFWYHAFYSDSSTFLFSIPSLLMILSSIVALAGFLVILYRADRFITLWQSGPDARRDALRANLYASIAILAGTALVSFGLFDRSTDRDREIYTGNPEYQSLSALHQYLFEPAARHVAMPGPELALKMKRCGIVLGESGTAYPLMKKSIHVLPAGQRGTAPRVRAKTNVIVVFLESFNQIFTDEERTRLPGLTPGLHRMMDRSITFTNMHCSIFPTIRGTIATLGSSLYMIDKVQGIGAGKKAGIRPPILSRFLFLSDILKERGYATAHIQGGSGIFAGMKSAFVGRQHYDIFHSWESLELQRFVSGTRKSNWGIRDEDVFRFAWRQVESGKLREPFLLTLSTLDFHPPYDPLLRYPGKPDNQFLSAIYTTDAAFGEFWDSFERSPLRENTIVIAVSDHTAGNNQYLQQFMSDQIRGYRFAQNDRIVCVMYLPGNTRLAGTKNDVMCTNLDIAPTVLEIMGIDEPNPFIGLPIFSERPAFPLPLCNYDNVEMAMAHGRQANRAKVQGIRWTAQDQEEFNAFMRSLATERRFYPEETRGANGK